MRDSNRGPLLSLLSFFLYLPLPFDFKTYFALLIYLCETLNSTPVEFRDKGLCGSASCAPRVIPGGDE